MIPLEIVTLLVFVLRSTKVMLVVVPRLVGRTISAVARSYITDANEAATAPVMVVVFVFAPELVRVMVLVKVPTFDPLSLTHNKAFEELLAIERVLVNVELLVDTCQLVESESVTVILVVRLDAVTLNARLALVIP